MDNFVEFLYSKFLQSDGVSIDTRKIQPDNLFFGIVGPNFDGGAYAEQALEKGASFAVVQDKKYLTDPRIIYTEDTTKALQDLAIFHRGRFNKKRIVFALTGSNGKTTTKELIHRVLAKKYITHATEGNYNNHLGVPITLLHIHPQVEISIIEMGANHVGEIADLCRIANPTHGLITNIGDAHSETFGGREGIIRGKSELYDHLRKTEGTVFINTLDEVLINMKKRFSDPVLYPSDGIKFLDANPFVRLEIEGMVVQTQIVGDYNFENISAAIALGQFFGVDNQQIIEAIQEYNPGNMRSQLIVRDTNKIILDAYNANPTSMKLAINNLAGFSERKIAIIGGMEEVEDAEAAHIEIANQMADLKIDHVFLIGERTKIMQDYLPSSKWFADRDEFKFFVEGEKFSDSVILIKASRAAKLEEIEQYI